MATRRPRGLSIILEFGCKKCNNTCKRLPHAALLRHSKKTLGQLFKFHKTSKYVYMYLLYYYVSSNFYCSTLQDPPMRQGKGVGLYPHLNREQECPLKTGHYWFSKYLKPVDEIKRLNHFLNFVFEFLTYISTVA